MKVIYLRRVAVKYSAYHLLHEGDLRCVVPPGGTVQLVLPERLEVVGGGRDREQVTQ